MSLRKTSIWDKFPDDFPGHAHKWNKNDTPDKVAKAFGFKDFKAIWEYSPNKAIAKKRKKPESLEAGDELEIPANPAMLSKLKEAVEKWNKTKRAYVAYGEVIEGRIADAEKQADAILDAIGDLHRAVADDKDKRALAMTAVNLLDGLTKSVDSMLKLTSPFGTPQTSGLAKATAAVSSQAAKLKGGLFTDVEIMSLEQALRATRIEIGKMNAELERLDKELEAEAEKTIAVFRSDKLLKAAAEVLLKALG